MRRGIGLLAVGCALLLVSILCTLFPAAATDLGLASASFFTASQATTGGVVYARECASCHGAAMEGVAGPALKGPMFRQLAATQSLTAQSLLEVVSQSMPQGNPGSLTPVQYNAVVAYILQQNGYNSGSVELSPDNPELKNLGLNR
jgi:mono/diheme cytochrome c family protein